MNILLVGEYSRGTALESIYNNLIKLGIDAEVINTNDFFKPSILNRILNRFLRLPRYFGIGVKKINKIILEKTFVDKFDFIIFMKPILIYPKTIAEVKKYSKVICLSMDSISYSKINSNYFYSSLPLFDLCLLNTDYNNIEIAKNKFGVKKIYFLPFTADVLCHYPVETSFINKSGIGADIVFLGTYAKNEKRVEYMERLCQEGYDVKIYGNSWDKLPRSSCLIKENRIIFGNTPCEKMAEIISLSKIILAFMRETINEQIAFRTFEIPLCGGFMLHQRTKEAEKILIPEEEAVFFDSYEEMKNKIDFYLQHCELRDKIAKNGRRRILNCGMLNIDQVKKMIDILKKEFGG